MVLSHQLKPVLFHRKIMVMNRLGAPSSSTGSFSCASTRVASDITTDSLLGVPSRVYVRWVEVEGGRGGERDPSVGGLLFPLFSAASGPAGLTSSS